MGRSARPVPVILKLLDPGQDGALGSQRQVLDVGVGSVGDVHAGLERRIEANLILAELLERAVVPHVGMHSARKDGWRQLEPELRDPGRVAALAPPGWGQGG